MAVLKNLLNLYLFSFNRCKGDHSKLEIIQWISPCVSSDPNSGIFKTSKQFPKQQDEEFKKQLYITFYLSLTDYFGTHGIAKNDVLNMLSNPP